METVIRRLSPRRDSSSNFASANPVLFPGEIAVDTTLKKFKFGDGVTAWLSLPFMTDGLPYTGGTSNVDIGAYNLTVDTNTLFVDSVNHSVLIGTTTPITSFGGAKLRVYGGGSTALTWYGRIVAGGDANVFLMGQIDGKAVLGGHNTGLTAWTPLYINPSTAGNVYIGNSASYGASTLATTILSVIGSTGNVGIGTTSPTAVLHLKAGTATANTAPIKLTSGVLNTTPEPGAIEFLTDAYYATITTGAARKTFAFLESPIFTGNLTLASGDIRWGTNFVLTTVNGGANPAFKSTLSGGAANFRIQSQDLDGTDDTSFNIDAVGIPGDANRETFVIGYTAGTQNYRISSFASGTGTLRPIYISATGTVTNQLALLTNGNVGIGIAPTAVLHLKAGTATANTAPLKIATGGVLNTTPEPGAIETDANHIYWVRADGTRLQLD